MSAIIIAIALLLSSILHGVRGVCQEDQSCWDCSAMGNKICGEEDK